AGPLTCAQSATTSYTIPPPQIHANPSHGRAGESISIHGSSFVPQFSSRVLEGTITPHVSLRWGTQLLDSFSQPNPAGTWSDFVTVPANAAFGSTHLNACTSGDSGCSKGWSATSPFSVPHPEITLSKSSGMAGDAFTVAGSGMYSGSKLRAFFGSSKNP